MLGLSKQFIPVVVATFVSYNLSPFVPYAWILMIIIPVIYALSSFFYKVGYKNENQSVSDIVSNICGNLYIEKPVLKEVRYGRFESIGIFGNRQIICPRAKAGKWVFSSEVDKGVIGHEIAHIYYRHHEAKLLYITMSCAVNTILFLLKMNWLILLLSCGLLMYLYCYLILIMEIQADKLAQTYGKIDRYLKYHANQSTCTIKRLKALDA